MINTSKINLDEINSSIKENGYYFIEDFLDISAIDSISKELKLWNVKLNSNDLSPVYNRASMFYSNALAESKTLFNFLTDKSIIDICNNIIGSQFRLKAHRVYNLSKNYKFPWHTDNKSVDVKNDSNGIVFIIYMDDVKDGETQVIKGSHKYSHKYNKSNLDNSFVNKNFKDDIISLYGNKGSLIIFDQSIIHRGKPITSSKINRSAIFFQIDNNMENAERLLLNSEFLNKKDIEIYKNIFGFGKKASFPVSPDTTSLKTIPPKHLALIFFKIPFWIALYFTNIFRSKMPNFIKNYIKNFF